MDPKLFAEFESPGFSARVNVVSGYNQFLRAIASQPEVSGLLEGLQSSDSLIELLIHVLELAARATDEGYENPNDVALATYLWVLSMSDPAATQFAAEEVRQCRRCWWARKLADRLRSAGPAKTATANITRV